MRDSGLSEAHNKQRVILLLDGKFTKQKSALGLLGRTNARLSFVDDLASMSKSSGAEIQHSLLNSACVRYYKISKHNTNLSKVSWFSALLQVDKQAFREGILQKLP